MDFLIFGKTFRRVPELKPSSCAGCHFLTSTGECSPDGMDADGGLLCGPNDDIVIQIPDDLVATQRENRRLRENLIMIKDWIQNLSNKTIDMGV